MRVSMVEVRRSIRPAVYAALLLFGPSLPVAPAAQPETAGPCVPVVYGTDLFHPHDDPDDHYDLATLMAIEQLQVKAILLDLAERQRQRPGRIPLEQMFHLTGRRIPYATGLGRKLNSSADKGLDAPGEEQAAVELLLATLRTASEPVTIITAGSLRDVCAAFNREPEVLKAKVRRIYVNIGAANDQAEWNVGLDVHAYVGLMRSGLPLYWCPCLPMAAHRHSTYWKFQQGRMLEGLPRPLLNYFVYALQRVPPEELDPLRAIDADLRPWRHLLGTMERNMWCTASFLHAAGLGAREANGRFVPTTQPVADDQAPFTFVRAVVEIDDAGRTRSIAEVPSGGIHVFAAADHGRYQRAMSDCLRGLLERMVFAPGHSQPAAAPDGNGQAHAHNAGHHVADDAEGP